MNCPQTRKNDYLFILSIAVSTCLYIAQGVFSNHLTHSYKLAELALHHYEILNTLWWGALLGILTIALLTKVPREFVIAALGRGKRLDGILRATLGGILLDLCSHGILMVATKLYERGASTGQVMAFLIASPWNSFSLTFILISLIGVYWTIAFILLSLAIAIITGLIFDVLITKKILPDNPNRFDLPEDFSFVQSAKAAITKTRFDCAFFMSALRQGVIESKVVIKWLVIGTILAAAIRTYVNIQQFQNYFGPTWLGLGFTLVFATIIEVCSEGSIPLAADLLNRAASPGNAFAFLMSGVSTDYTEIMILREATGSWKIALFLPLITLPQIILVSGIINHATH